MLKDVFNCNRGTLMIDDTYKARMSGKKLIIFDLDGTINDSRKSYFHCLRMAAEGIGRYDLTDKDFELCLTGPFDVSIQRIFGFSGPEEMQYALKLYVDAYNNGGNTLFEMYPGVDKTLKYLKDRGYLIGMATCTLRHFAEDRLDLLHIRDYFDDVCGVAEDLKMRKDDVIKCCLDELKVDPADAVMVGDSFDDRNAALKCGVDFIGTVYGYELREDTCKQESIQYIDAIQDLMYVF